MKEIEIELESFKELLDGEPSGYHLVMMDIREWYNLNLEYTYGDLKQFARLMTIMYDYERILAIKTSLGAKGKDKLVELKLESVYTIIEFILDTY